VAQVFTGKFRRSLDGKNRVLVPSEIRDSLDAADREGLFLIPSKKCVFLWTRSYLDSYATLQGADPFKNLQFNRTFFPQMIFKTFDGTGRIVFPAEVVERFPDREVLISGNGRYLEAWHPPSFDAEVKAFDPE